MTGLIALGVLLLGTGIVLVYGIAIYNRLVVLRNTCDSSWSDIDVQLKRRWDLIPNLVETVKGYAAHEKQTFEAVVDARGRAMQAEGPVEKSSAEGLLGRTLKSLFALAEAYPELKANENFLSLQSELSALEDAIQKARRYYNAVVRDFNTLCETVPSNLVAGMFGFRKRDYFELDSEAERNVPAVSFAS
jgi:LemA protein